MNESFPMSCAAAQPLLPTYVDDELDSRLSLPLQQHLDDCTHCRALLDEARALRRGLRETLPYHRAPADLRARLRARLDVETANGIDNEPASASAAADTLPPAAAGGAVGTVANLARHDPRDHSRRPPSRRASRALHSWTRWSSTLAASLALVIGLNLWLAHDRQTQTLTNTLIACHVRSLQAEHLTDVASSDQHTVKPWFIGRLDYAPPVHDTAAQGYPLLGGRLDYAAQRPVAALIYARRKHYINVFLWPADDSGDSSPRSIHRNGYVLLRWTHGGMQYWAVSDVNESDLRELAQLLSES